MKSLTLPAYAKINLTMDVLGRRADGYHSVETIMQAVSLCDTVTVGVEDGEGVFCGLAPGMPDTPAFPKDGENTAGKAAAAYLRFYGISGKKVSVTIEKLIPSQAGLGGGSSDAAAVLTALDKLFEKETPKAELERLGAQIGADVPFFIRGGLQLCCGIGEQLTVLPELPRMTAVIVKPKFGNSTARIFAELDKKSGLSRPDTGRALSAIRSGDTDELCKCVFNIFDGALPAGQAKTVLRIRELMFSGDAQASALTGTGSCVFGLFYNEEAAKCARDKAEGEGFCAYLCSTIGYRE
ncbi:MAG: 4-(cytidine 5'-diphospho)-2-C-methyl-D-erythritol kinase [Oscillospiraceae bacterium]|jgi:4-diphosphocytidyl-2-C-methyl-D-erythritol kinase|nr:4-(cytidine 5'-diphospho)-2-C-methyl-D-erythritol kinase [Oscillospiraceae bacterium]